MQATPETAKLVVLSGPPCSGKSALAASLGAHTRLSYEEQNKSKHAAKKLTARTLGNSQQVVVDDQNLPAELRATLLPQARRRGDFREHRAASGHRAHAGDGETDKYLQPCVGGHHRDQIERAN